MKRFSIIILFVLVISSCSGNKWHEFKGYAQGGTYSIKANLKDARLSKDEIGSGIRSLLDSIDCSLSGYNGNSILSRFNAGEAVTPDRFFIECLNLSDKYSQLSQGAFDVWSAPLYDAWGFGFSTDSLPDPQKIQEAIELSRGHKKMNFNAIAQGYSCDVIASYLRGLGVKDMLVNIGEIYCCGLNPKGKPWTVGVDRPVDGNNEPGKDIQGIWSSEGQALGIVTSGNYRKYYIKDGVKYAHTIDPRTGYPVTHSLLSATVTAPNAAEADALATTCMVLGPEKARELILKLEGVEAYLICADSVWLSPGFTLKQ